MHQKLSRTEKAAFSRYLDGKISISEVCRRCLYVRKTDGRPEVSTFYRRFHHYYMQHVRG